MLRTLSLVVLLAVACGGGAKVAPDTVATAGDHPVVHLALGEMKLIDVDKHQAALIHGDGTVEIGGTKIAKVTADGKLVEPNTGEVALTLNPDGTVTASDGKDLGVKIGADGKVTMGDKTIAIARNGEVIGGNRNAPKMKIEGALDDKLKRTAMFVVVSLLMAGDSHTEVR